MIVVMRIGMVVLALVAAGCGGGSLSRFEFVRVQMGVESRVAVYSKDRPVATEAAQKAFDEIARLEDLFSDYRPRSELSRLGAASGGPAVPVSPELFEILTISQRVHRASGGAFDPTVGPCVEIWRGARRTGAMPAPEVLSRARMLTGFELIHLDPEHRTVRLEHAGMKLDLGGIAKGYAAQRAVDLLRAGGAPRCLVSLAGDVVAGDPPPGEAGWRVAVLSEQPGAEPAAILLVRAAASTSGDTQQFVELGGVRYSHVIDPRTGLGATVRRSATVVAARGEWADAMCKAACLDGADAGWRAVETVGLEGTTAIIVDSALHAGGVERRVMDPSRRLSWAGPAPRADRPGAPP